MKCSLKWRPTLPSKRPDKIISSDSRLRGDTMGFQPTYEVDPHVNMFLLLSNEYQRKWFNEKKVYDKINYAQVQTYMEESSIRRRFVQRDLRRRIVQKRLPIIKLKEFQNIPSKTDHKWINKNNEKDEKGVIIINENKLAEEMKKTDDGGKTNKLKEQQQSGGIGRTKRDCKCRCIHNTNT